MVTHNSMTRADAINLLRVKPGVRIYFWTKDATLQHHCQVRVWLDDDGDLVQSHPTDPRAQPISAPADVSYVERRDGEHDEVATVSPGAASRAPTVRL